MSRAFIERTKRQITSLDGMWFFKTDADNLGKENGWYNGFTDGEQISVSSVWNTEFGLTEYKGAVWYSKNFYFCGGNLRLNFEAVMTYAEVWLDGKLLGDHYGGYTQFDFYVSNAKVYTHPYGCSQLGGDLETTQKVLAGLIKHPNAGGVLVLGLGCENNEIHLMKSALGDYDEKRIKFLILQDCEDEIEEGLKIITELKAITDTDIRTEIPLSALRIGVKCGGSDGYSGITANPLVGLVADRFFEYNAKILMTEMPEAFGAEQILLERSDSKETFDAASAMLKGFRQYFIDHGDIHCNISPDGNYIIGDGYPRDGYRLLWAYSLKTGKSRLLLKAVTREDIAKGDFRCDLHARFVWGGKAISFDTTCNGKREVVVIPTTALDF